MTARDGGSGNQGAQSAGPSRQGAAADAPRIPAPEAGAYAPRVPSGAHVKQGSRMALRNWRISTRLVSLLALPVVAATTLGALRIESSWKDMQRQEDMKLLTEMTEQATNLAKQIQSERDKSAGAIIEEGPKDSEVQYLRETTAGYVERFNNATRKIESSDTGSLRGVRSSLLRISSKLQQLDAIREKAFIGDNGDKGANALQSVQAYSEVIDSLIDLSNDMAAATNNSDMIEATRALAIFSSAKENASIQRAVASAGIAARNALTPEEEAEVSAAVTNEKDDIKQFTQLYGQQDAEELLDPLQSNNAIQQANQLVKNLLNHPQDPGQAGITTHLNWFQTYSPRLEQMDKIEATLLQGLQQKSRQLAAEAERDAWISGALIILVLGISLTGAFIVARSMVRSLRRLQDTAEVVAQKRLPELVKQLSEADPQDVDTSVESVGIHTRDEIGKVAAAFDDVHREAVRLAAEQALLRGNVNAMFTNLSRRSQGLIQRQLSLISELESREADPDQLASLFKLDHLATRMRRNGENLLVLAGEEPGRRWTRPVPLVDVLRAAASEVEQYERIELSAVPATQVAGRVVNDLVHLLAELLENATSFSSPQTKVKVTGHALPDGRVLIEIHDTGIGLSPEDLAAINERLASPPTVDVSVSRRMGLFVVGRLSLRHGIRIQLRPSDSGGTTALVMLPVDVTQNGQNSGGKQSPAAAGPTKGSATSRLGAAQQRGQLGRGATEQLGSGGQRPALPSRGEGVGQQPMGGRPGGPSLPTRGETQHSGAQDDRFAARMGDTGRIPPVTDGPRGHEEVDSTAQFARPDFSGPAPAAQPNPGMPAGPAQPPVPGQAASYGSAHDTGQFPMPGPGPQQTGQFQTGQFPTGPHQTGQFPAPHDTGQMPRIQDTGQMPRIQDTGQLPRVQDTGQFPMPGPQHTGEYAQPHDTGQFPAPQPYDTGQYPAPEPQRTGEYPQPRQPHDTGQFASAAYQDGQPLGDTMAPRGNEPTPLFSELESDWFRGTRGGRVVPPVPAPQPATPPAPAQAPRMPEPAQRATTTTAPAIPPRPSRGPAPMTAPAAPAAAPQQQPEWRQSPNDAVWRRAEQLRTGPSAGGITTSGLPRRVPRANLVEGSAQQQSNQSGPQVSRAPDQVRGRLTSLRRGIEQGRQAGGTNGSNSSGYGPPTYSQER
ncbi:nitrate- and nitrite sensing domain-containing protein [Streptomyces sp. NPDC051940]|uniref:sensor histidine kinase n=1 Tax=Streptomyces sp. NPDC051940 TaxID=3155675 RepID=UPI0034269F6A